MIPLSIPNLTGNEWRYVKDCLDTGWISSAGAYVNQFEHKLAEYIGAKYAVACVNGTAGLHVSLRVLGVERGDYVLAPNLTFIATLNAVRYCGADPILFDCDALNWQLDLDLLEQFLQEQTEQRANGCVLKADGRRIAALLPVHVLGNIADMNKMLQLSQQHNIPIVEDACESLGSTFQGRHSGTFGRCGVFSFNGNKIMSTGGGGMIVSDDHDFAQRAAHLTTQAKTSAHEYVHDEIGYNYRMVNILAALGVAQMEVLPTNVSANRKRDAYYRAELADIPDVRFQQVSDDVHSNSWLFTLQVPNMSELLHYLNENGVQARPFWRPMNRLPMFADSTYVSESDNCASIYESAISIPSSSHISDAELEEVVRTVRRFYDLPTQSSSRSMQRSVAERDWKVQLFELNYDESEARAVQQVINSRWITMGSQTKHFESSFSKLLQERVHCKAVSSCTAALHTALVSLGLGAGDEVIIPALTFVADANVVRIVGAEPVPADSESLHDWNVSARTIEARITEKTRAVMLVHYAGYPCDMDPIVELCKRHNLPLIEDVAHAPGAEYKGQACGTFGDFGCFSFFSNKNLSIGEGGMLSTPSAEHDRKVGIFRSQGMSSQTLDRHKGHSSKYDVLASGLNYRMDEMRAAIGLVQLGKLESGNEARKELVEHYHYCLRHEHQLEIPFLETGDVKPAYHIFPVLVPVDASRDEVMRLMREERIQTSIHYQSFRDFTVFDGANFPATAVADEVSRRVVTLPLYPTMTKAQVELVCDTLRNAIIAGQRQF